ncbi:uncharacterized protein LOC134221036 [Armigeres subalbatus]|uniref:uncharacterized protein LOC134221036 n=1 Tax=Armigeres subalbatus TaxID=124917 RepID=UPI002ED4DABC
MCNDTTYYKCADKSACRARFVVRGTVGSYSTNIHTHPQHTLEIAKNELKQALKVASAESFEGYKAVFDKVCLRPEHREAAKHVLYASVQASMRNARSKCFPRAPTTALEFDKLMMTDNATGFRTICGEAFYHGCVGVKGRGITLFFVVPGTIAALKEAESTTLFFDGTYKTKPTIFKQLIMAYAKIQEKVFPLAFMPSEIGAATTNEYAAIMEKLVAIMPTVAVVATISDFEKSLMKACRAVFESATHHGCLFHYKQAVRRHIVQLGVLQTSSEYYKYRLAMQLPHLPAHLIPTGIEIVITYLKAKAHDKIIADKFGKYLKTQWIKQIDPKIYSTYRMEITSNNAAESFHAKMLREIGVNPTPWIFVEKIICLSKTTALDIERGSNYLYKRQQTERQLLVNKLSKKFDADGNVMAFLMALNAKNKNIELGCINLEEKEEAVQLDVLEECIICAKCASVTLTPCGHKPYCRVCVWKAVSDNPKCPICGTLWNGIQKDN